jgi:hypothetical protein
MLGILIILAFVVAVIVYAFNKEAGFIAIQIVAALAILYGVYFLALVVIVSDSLATTGTSLVTQYVKTTIIDGYEDSATLSHTMVDTVNPASKFYAFLPRSINREGGAQFTYQYWLLLTDTSDTTIASKDILVRGDITPYNLETLDRDGNLIKTYQGTVIKCPRIRFNGSYDNIAVELNTMDDPNPDPIVISSSPYNASGSQDATAARNVLRLTPNKWVLYTFAFLDSEKVNEFENGIEVRFFINDLLYQTSTMRSSLRQNNGHLYLFPSGPIQGCQIGDLAYYNYAVSLPDIQTVYNAGPPRVNSSLSQTPGSVAPLYLTEYNKLNIYNS